MTYKSMFLSDRSVVNHIVVSAQELTAEQISVISAALTSSYVDSPYQPDRLNNPDSIINNYQYNGTYLPYSRILTKYGFNSRFTIDELVAIQDAAKTDSLVSVLNTKFTIADEINLDEQATIDGLGALVAKGLLTEARMNEIMG